MGAKFWFLAASDGDARARLKARPTPDRAASVALAKELFGPRLKEAGEANLVEADPRGGEVLVGVYPGVTVVAAEALGLDRPSTLPERFLDLGRGRRLTLHAQHSVVDWAAFALWEDGVLRRSLSVSPDDGIIEDIGERLPFEAAFWAPPEEDDLPFGHPLDLGEEALLAFLGFQFEGHPDAWLIDPEDLIVPRFRSRPAWRFW